MVRLADHLTMTIISDWDVKPQTKPKQINRTCMWHIILNFNIITFQEKENCLKARQVSKKSKNYHQRVVI